ncbi:YxiG-like protein [Micromonospora musae]|uniref:YxiG-like protein n=1 Tax=Micromonospora musae TaxID=1894970 RepID=UPI001F3AD7CB|nr:hypothetical protein [Micromonospora musae]
MEIAELRRALDDVFDQAVVYHAYTNYMRDYEVIVYATADPSTGIQPAHLRYLFKHCVQAEVSTALSPDIWRKSLDERLTDPEIGPDLDGHVWAVRWQQLRMTTATAPCRGSHPAALPSKARDSPMFSKVRMPLPSPYQGGHVTPAARLGSKNSSSKT